MMTLKEYEQMRKDRREVTDEGRETGDEGRIPSEGEYHYAAVEDED